MLLTKGNRCRTTAVFTSWAHRTFHPPFLVTNVFVNIIYFSFFLSLAHSQSFSSNDSHNAFYPSNSITTKPSSNEDFFYDGLETTPNLSDSFNAVNAGHEVDKQNLNSENTESEISVINQQYTLNVTVSPSNLVANCTDVELYCKLILNVQNETFNVDSGHSFWWTFRGSNISALTLPGGRVTNENSNLSILNVDCAQFGVHNGDYECHHSSTESNNQMDSFIERGNASLAIYVPLSLESVEPSNGTVRELIDSQVQLKCHIFAHPKPKITWQRIDLNTLTVSDIEEDGRILVETKSFTESQKTHLTTLPSQIQISLHIPTITESVLNFKSLMRSDNGSYACKAQSSYPFEKPLLSHFNVIVLEIPQIHIEKLEIENKTAAIVTFIVDYDGNLPVQKYMLEVMNFSMTNSSWNVHNVLPNSVMTNRNYSVIDVENLTPGANYGFRLCAQNEVGSSDWSFMNISVPPDVPSSISNVHLLSKTNETLLFGWRRPLLDNGGTISQYQMILKDSSLEPMDTVISNQTLDIASTSQTRNNYMYMFPNLKPGSHYSFQVRACSQIGCSEWSAVLDAVTSDGHSDPPLNIHLECIFDYLLLQNNATITWEPPTNPRGSIVGYNISLEGFSHYKNSHNHFVLDQFRHFHEVLSADTFGYRLVLKPNSNYTVRLCAINKSGCGSFSHITSSAMCQTAPVTPSEFPLNMKFEYLKPTIVKNNIGVSIAPFSAGRQVKLFVPRLSERNGAIKCYRIIMLRLPSPELFSNQTSDKVSLSEKLLANGPDSVVLSSYRFVSENRKDAFGAYIDKEFSSDSFKSEIIIGDGKSDRCLEDSPQYDLKSRIKASALSTEDNRSPRRISYDFATNESHYGESNSTLAKSLVEDGELLANTNYTGFVEVTVLSWNNTILVGRSPFIEPILTEPFQLIIPELSKSSFSETAHGIFFGTICGLLLVIILLFSVLCFLKRKAIETSQPILEDEAIGLTSIIRRTIRGKRKNSLFHQINLNSIGSIKKWASTPIPIQNLMAVFQERHANSDFLFQAEFESLPESFPDRTTTYCDAPENVSKNRYPDIKSYDQTRVALSKIDDVPTSDYINADFVSGYNNRKQFICAQGPIQKTIGDFWRLVFEQNCSIIVMLTGIEEQGRIKCAPYWSDEQSKEVTPTLSVSLTSRREYSDYVIRQFSLQNTEAGEIRDVLHFHFVAWRDFLAPEQPSWLLRFIKRVNEHHCADRGPLLVHCSAGVGRTGTFIAIDNLINEIDDGATHINVFECVSQLRYQRNFLVQSVKQYIFVYRAIMEYVEFGDTEIEMSQLNDHYRQLKEQNFECGNGILMEFEKLNEVMEDVKSVVVGRMDVNRSKNRYDFIIPYDFNRVILSPSSAKDQPYYINASFIKGYDHLLTFIVTQDPMEETTNEFWWMILEQSVTTLVMLAELGEGQSKCHCYWPAEEFDCDYVKVKLIEEEMSQYFTKRVFNITQKKTNAEHTVTQYQFLQWKSGVVPESTVSLFTLIDVVLANNSLSSSPILVHCSGGGDRSSVFVAFASLVKQLRLEERVDIFQTARYTRSQRQCMLKTIAQYDFLYRCIIDYIDYHNLCNNSDTLL